MNSAWFAIIAFCASYVLTAFVRRYAIAKSVMDIPNSRSSHSVPTPRGGGIAIVFSVLVISPFLYFQGELSLPLLISCLGAGGGIALIGFMDDHGHIAPLVRLMGHFLSASWVLAWLGYFRTVDIFGMQIEVHWLGYILSAFYLVWMLNLYNFMDGIDGIASVQAITVTVAASFIYWWLQEFSLMWPALLLAAATAGFLFWNFPPAKIFMGDAGSGFTGIMLGILSMQAGWYSPDLFYAWLVLMGVFIVDATFTLLRRLVRRDRVFEAHRSHAFQYAARQHKGHLPVTLSVCVLNLCWLAPLAFGMAVYKWNGILITVIAYVPLIALAIKYNAGKLEAVDLPGNTSAGA
jgi:Fuc2NAc and GlcNAc transferase